MSESGKGNMPPTKPAERWKRVSKKWLERSGKLDAAMFEEKAVERKGRRKTLEGIPMFLLLLQQLDPEFDVRLETFQSYAEINDIQGLVLTLEELLGEIGEPSGDKYLTLLNSAARALIIGFSNFQFTQEELIRAFAGPKNPLG